MPSEAVVIWGEFEEEGMLDGLIREGDAFGGVASEGRGPVVRALRISRSSKNSSMPPSDGSLASRSLSDTSSMRACDIVACVVFCCGELER